MECKHCLMSYQTDIKEPGWYSDYKTQPKKWKCNINYPTDFVIGIDKKLDCYEMREDGKYKCGEEGLFWESKNIPF